MDDHLAVRRLRAYEGSELRDSVKAALQAVAPGTAAITAFFA